MDGKVAVAVAEVKGKDASQLRKINKDQLILALLGSREIYANLVSDYNELAKSQSSLLKKIKSSFPAIVLEKHGINIKK